MPELAVHLYGVVVGHLVGDSWRDFDFEASAPGIQRFGIVGAGVRRRPALALPEHRRSHGPGYQWRL